MDQNNIPAWYSSPTTWGGLIAVAAGIGGFFGYRMSPEEQEAVVAAVTSIAAAVGGLIVVYRKHKARREALKAQ